jgi:serine/threonine-protein kinase RsbW
MDEQVHCLPNMVLSFKMTIKSHRGELAQAADRIMSVVQTLPCVPEDLDNVHLALLEALSNAVIHGNREDPGKNVGICTDCDGQSQMLIAVTDQGDGFDPTALADPTSAENISAIHGRGVFLMRHLGDEVEFNLDGRQIVLHKRIQTQPRTRGLTDHTVRTLH